MSRCESDTYAGEIIEGDTGVRTGGHVGGVLGCVAAVLLRELQAPEAVEAERDPSHAEEHGLRGGGDEAMMFVGLRGMRSVPFRCRLGVPWA